MKAEGLCRGELTGPGEVREGLASVDGRELSRQKGGESGLGQREES